MIKQFISIPIKINNENWGTLTISSDFSQEEYDVKHRFSKILDLNVNLLKSSISYSIPFKVDFEYILEENSLDNITPIQYLTSNSYSTNIFLLEETEYTFCFIPNKKFSNDSKIKAFDYLENHKSNIDFVCDSIENYYIAHVNFRSYAGKTFINIIHDDIEFSMMVEVRSKKLDYNNEYSQMIADLSKISSGLLFNMNAPLSQKHDKTNDFKNTLYSDFMLLEYLFRPQNLPAVFEYLSRNLYSLLDNTSEIVPTDFAYNIGAEEIAELSSNPLDFCETTLNYSIFSDEGKYFVPLRIKEGSYWDNVDVPENRFFKFFLEYIRDLIIYLDNNVEKGQIKLSLENFYETINLMLSSRFFNDISRLEYLPLNSQVLQKKEGYREILEYYYMFENNYKINFNDLNDLLDGFEKELYRIYEIWCYFKLIAIIDELTNSSKRDLKKFFNKKTNQWSLSLSEISNLNDFKTFHIGEYEIKFTLKYNYFFYGVNKENYNKFSSYSVNLHPDYSLLFEYGENNYKFMHFDAKYKFNGETGFTKEDIYKMHTYKDAINDSIGAYVFYPGDGEPDIFKENDGSFGSVGAFSLKPGIDEINKEEIKKFICKNIKNWLNFEINSKNKDGS